MKKVREYIESIGMELNPTPGGYYICRYPRNYRLFIVFKMRAAKFIKIYNEQLKYKGPVPTVPQLRKLLSEYGLLK